MTERVSFSRVDTWRQCPRKYYYRYIMGLESKPDYSATNPLILGSTLDTASQYGYEVAEQYYFDQYPVMTDEGFTELIKIEYWTPQVQKIFEGAQFQVEMKTDRFLGYADAVVGDCLYDLKYSNNIDKYAESAQLHIYASELPTRPNRMAYVCVPKTFIRQKQDEDIMQFRKRVMQTLREMEIKIVWVDYDQTKVDDFWVDVERMKVDTTYEATENEYCKWCDFKDICKKPIVIEEKPKRKLKPRSEIKLNY